MRSAPRVSSRTLLVAGVLNALLAATFVRFGLAYRMWKWMDPTPPETPLELHTLLPKYLGIYFAAWALINLPFLTWRTISGRFVRFFIGVSLILMAQTLLPGGWM